MDTECIRATGWDSLWPIPQVVDRLAQWLDVNQLDEAYTAVMASNKDIRPLRKLQSVQTLAYRLIRLWSPVFLAHCELS